MDNAILTICLTCLSRRMPDGTIEISSEELQELEHDDNFYGIKIEGIDGNLIISPADKLSIEKLKKIKHKQDFFRNLKKKR